MANSYTTTQLLASLKRRGLIPSTAETLSTSDFVEIANEEMQTFIVPAILSVREEYFVTDKDTTNGAAGTVLFDIPYRAIGGKLREVMVSTDAGATFQQLERLDGSNGFNDDGTGTPFGYRIENNSLVMDRGVNDGVVIRMRYFQRPGHLVIDTDTTKVARITATNGTSTVSATAGTPAFMSGAPYDVVKDQPGFMCLTNDATPTYSAGVWTFTSLAFPGGVAVNDWLCVADSSPIPQIPVEFHAILAQRVAFKVLEATGFGQQAQLAKAVGDEMMGRAINLITNRDESQAPILMNPYGPGWGSGRRRAWRR